MRVATFNLESLDLRAGEGGAFARRAAALGPLLERLAADVLCLQEVNAQRGERGGPRNFAALDRLLAGSRYEAYHRAFSLLPGTEGPQDVHNLVVLSRWPIGFQRAVHHDLVAPWRWTPPVAGREPAAPVDVRWDRPILQVRVEPPGTRPIHFLNLHLRASRAAYIPGLKALSRWRSSASWAEGFCLAAQKQVGQALEARLLVEALLDAEPEARILVCGDLNADEHEMPVRLLCASAEDIEDPAFAARSLEPLEDRLPQARRFSVRHAGRPVMLDHLLASAGAARACTGIEVLNEKLGDEVLDAAAEPGSLHAALVASFGWD